MTSSVADLMRRNLLDDFNERDPDRRASAVAEVYAEDVVWHEPDRVGSAPSSPRPVSRPS